MQPECGWLQRQSHFSSFLYCNEACICIMPAGEAARATHHREVPRFTFLALGLCVTQHPFLPLQSPSSQTWLSAAAFFTVRPSILSFCIAQTGSSVVDGFDSDARPTPSLIPQSKKQDAEGGGARLIDCLLLDLSSDPHCLCKS